MRIKKEFAISYHQNCTVIKHGRISKFKNSDIKFFLGLVELLDAAKTFIPKEYWKTTPITLKATAGLRLLPKEEGDAILEVARKVRLILTP